MHPPVRQPDAQRSVFISYSWDDDAHRAWIARLAQTLRQQNIHVIVDKTDLKFGAHIKSFMLGSIMKADFVLIILTPKYRLKAEKRINGAGYEYNIINDELFKLINKNEKFIPAVRGEWKKSITQFLQGFNCVDLRPGNNYEANLQQMIDQILSTRLKKERITRSDTSLQQQKLLPLKQVLAELSKKGEKYFHRLMDKQTPALTKQNILQTFGKWEQTTTKSSNKFMEAFGPEKMALYEDYLEDFKNAIFAKKLQTVRAALTASDPELVIYKKHFRDADNRTIYNAVKVMLAEATQYNTTIAPTVNYQSISNPSQLKMEFINNGTMLLNKIIGTSIRSEMLYNAFPMNFPLMTQPNMWAMYFLCVTADEFTKFDRNAKESQIRVSHNYQYPYDRFTFLMTFLFNRLSDWVAGYGFSLRPHLRFGYVNEFLFAVHALHREDVNALHQWTDAKKYD